MTSAIRLGLFWGFLKIVTMIALPTVAVTSKVADQQLSFWREQLPSVEVPETVVESMSPLTEEEANTLAKIIKDGNLQSHATQFCKSANLLCQQPVSVPSITRTIFIKFESNDLQTETRDIFFSPKELRKGGQITLPGPIYSPWKAFLPSDLSELIPFSKAALPDVLSSFGIPERSNMSLNMNMTLTACEAEPQEEESRKCTTSIESMIEYVLSNLGSSDNVDLVFHPSPMADDSGKKARVRNVVERMSGNQAPLSCHRLVYPYGVLYCHSIKGTFTYTLELEVLENHGNIYNATALCHPHGQSKESVYCHLILGDTLLWLTKVNH